MIYIYVNICIHTIKAFRPIRDVNFFIMTCRMAQGVTMMMNMRDIADRARTRLASASASTLSLIGLLATEEPTSIGSAQRNAFLSRKIFLKKIRKYFTFTKNISLNQ